MALQKFEKSFAVYVKAGYEFATAKKFPSNHEKLLREISNGLDDSVMMLDDIIDASKTRNGKACIYVQEGIPFTIIKAEKLRFESIRKMTKISNLLKTKDSFKIELFQAIHGYLFDLYRGEILISSSNKSSSFENYFLAVRLFTGGHVSTGFNVGQLLANKKPSKKLEKIAHSIGIIRQINDDIQDYFEKHHEPFGDFLSGNNRLPEVLFIKYGGNKKSVISLAKKGEIAKARNVVLNDKVKDAIRKIYIDEIKKIESTRLSFPHARFLEPISI